MKETPASGLDRLGRIWKIFPVALQRFGSGTNAPYVRGPGSDAGAGPIRRAARSRAPSSNNMEGMSMKAIRALAIAASIATLAACGGNNAANNAEANAALETENVETTVNATDLNAVETNAPAENATNATETNAATNNAY